MRDAMAELLDIIMAAARGNSRGGIRGAVLALVGAGGKTSALFALAEAARRGGAGRVALAATTKMRDPRFEAGRRFDRLVAEPRLGEAPPEGASLEALRGLWLGPGAETAVLAARAFEEGGDRKIGGLHPGLAPSIAGDFDLVLVEADGARGRSIKAPGEAEPVLPSRADAMIGLVGLDCLGAKLGDGVAHRPELLAALVGCPPGGPIAPRHVAALAASPQGLFKGCPPGAARILLLNKAELADEAAIREIASLAGRGAASGLGPDLVIAASFREGRAELVADLRGAGAREPARLLGEGAAI